MDIATQNGVDLSNQELADILTRGERFFGLTELRPFGAQSFGVVLQNVTYQPIDISFRVELFNDANSDAVRKDIQVAIAKYLDFRSFKSGEQKVEWDDLLSIVKRTRGVKYVPDQFFYPSQDIPTDNRKLPRLRGFLMLSLTGGVISSFNGVLSPVFYPQEADFSFQATVLRTI